MAKAHEISRGCSLINSYCVCGCMEPFCEGVCSPTGCSTTGGGVILLRRTSEARGGDIVVVASIWGSCGTTGGCCTPCTAGPTAGGVCPFLNRGTGRGSPGWTGCCTPGF